MSLLDPEVLKVIRDHGHAYIWHYTAMENLPSIFRLGAIYAKAELQRRGITFVSAHYYGSGRREEVLGEYVSCAPVPPWGMMQSERDAIALLRLDASVMAIPGTCFCPDWSPRGHLDPDEVVTWTGPEHLEELYTGADMKMVLPSEIFVPGEIPVSFVQRLIFFDEASQKEAQGALTTAARESPVKDHTVGVAVDPARFPRDWSESGPPWEQDEDDEPLL